MKIKDLTIKPVLGGAQISFLTEDLPAVDNLLKIADKDALYAKIERQRIKRSVNSNSYMWVLCDKIAEAIHSTKEEVYRNAIREVGVFQDVAVTVQALPQLIETWTSRGVGWLVDTFDSKIEGCKRVRLYTGSHKYDTRQMSRLIDFIVEDAKELNIEVLPPEELSRMLEEHNASYQSSQERQLHGDE